MRCDLGAEVTELELSSQFRCNGSDGYLAWLDDALDIRETANPTLDTAEYDFRVFDNPADLHALIELKNRANNRSRVVAGYCWKWPSKKDPQAWDIELPEFDYRRRWNLDKDGSLWIVTPGSVEQVGCIHTCQGLELDYVGVIIGPDLAYRDGRIVTDADAASVLGPIGQGAEEDDDRGSRDRASPGRRHRQEHLSDADDARHEGLLRVLHGQRWPRTFAAVATTSAVGVRQATRRDLPLRPSASASNVIPLRRVSPAERAAGFAAAPVVDLRFAAGHSPTSRLSKSGRPIGSPCRIGSVLSPAFSSRR